MSLLDIGHIQIFDCGLLHTLKIKRLSRDTKLIKNPKNQGIRARNLHLIFKLNLRSFVKDVHKKMAFSGNLSPLYLKIEKNLFSKFHTAS